MSIQRIKEFLDCQGARYAVITHSPAFTAQEVAASAHVPGKDMVKVVVVLIDERLALAAVPATSELDTDRLRTAAGAREVSIASEWEFDSRFPGCELGAMPPIGPLFGLETFMERALAKEAWIAFNAGTHRDVIAMPFSEYRRVSHPKLVHIARALSDTGLRTAQI